MLQLRNVNRMW